MCIITDEIKEVTNTEILVCFNNIQKEQLTIYSNKTINYKPNNFMILPVPSDVSDQIKFIDLTNIDVFSKLESLFSEKTRSYGTNSLDDCDSVEYFSIGSYDIFLVKNLKSISSSIISNSIFELLQKYYNKGFVFLFCKLKSGQEYKYHPLAYIHKVKDNTMFIPTKHLHIHKQSDIYEKNYEHWDHDIYVYNYQGNLAFKNQVLIEFSNEVKKYLGPKKFEKRIAIKDHSFSILPNIPFTHDKVDSINKFVIKNIFLNDDLICTVST